MDDLSGKISSFLENPENMEKIKSLTGLFSSEQSQPSTPNKESIGSELAESSIPKVHQETSNDFLSGIDPNMLLKFKRIMEKTSTKDDKRVNLLLALRPYMNEKRLGSMNSAMKIIRFSKLASVIGESLEL